MDVDAGRDVGRHLHEARSRAGLSKRELSERAGVDRATLREVEAGREPRVSTLAALTRSLPGVVPTELLGRPGRVPPALAEAWRFQRECQDVRARSITRRVRHPDRDELTLAGVRGAPGLELTRLMRAACAGGSAVLARLRPPTAPQRELVVELADERHEFRFGRGSASRSFTYVCARRPPVACPEECTSLPEALAAGVQVTVQLPVESLRLEVELPSADGRHPVLLAWPQALGAAEGESLTDRLHPGGQGLRWRRRGRVLAVTVERPLVGLRYALGWSRRRPDATRPPPEALPGLLGEAREAAGLSLRALGESMGVSAMTVKGAEEGRDVLLSTLDRYLDALPALSPWSLLPPLDEGCPSRERAWAYWRDLFGCEAEEVTKTVRVAASGGSRIALATRGLRSLRDRDRDLVVRLGLARSVLQPTRARLDEVDEPADHAGAGLRIRREVEPDGEPQHVLVIPARWAESGATFARRLVHAGVFTMTARAARERTGASGPFREGTTFGVGLPARRLRLRVEFPAGHRPLDVRAHAWGLTEVPDSDAPGLARRLHPEGLAARVDRRRRVVELVVEHPVPGFKYGLGWQLP